MRRAIIGIIVVAMLIGLAPWSVAAAQEQKEEYRVVNRLGIEQYEQGNYYKAIEYYNKAIEIDPNHPFAHNNRALAYFRLGEYDKAFSGYDKAIELKPDYAIAYANRGEVHLAQAISPAMANRIVSSEGELAAPLNKAISDFTKAIELDPSYVDAYYDRAVAYEQFILHYDTPYAADVTDKYNKALDDLDKVLEIEPNYVMVYAEKGNLYYRYGSTEEEWRKAIIEYNKALESEDLIVQKVAKEGLAGVYASRARSYLQVGEIDKAHSDYAKAMELNPNQPLIITQAIMLGLCAGSYGELLEQVKQVVTDPLKLALMMDFMLATMMPMITAMMSDPIGMSGYMYNMVDMTMLGLLPYMNIPQLLGGMLTFLAQPGVLGQIIFGVIAPLILRLPGALLLLLVYPPHAIPGWMVWD